MGAARKPGVIALFDVDDTLTVPRKVRRSFLQHFRAVRHSMLGGFNVLTDVLCE